MPKTTYGMLAGRVILIFFFLIFVIINIMHYRDDGLSMGFIFISFAMLSIPAAGLSVIVLTVVDSIFRR